MHLTVSLHNKKESRGKSPWTFSAWFNRTGPPVSHCTSLWVFTCGDGGNIVFVKSSIQSMVGYFRRSSRSSRSAANTSAYIVDKFTSASLIRSKSRKISAQSWASLIISKALFWIVLKKCIIIPPHLTLACPFIRADRGQSRISRVSIPHTFHISNINTRSSFLEVLK